MFDIQDNEYTQIGPFKNIVIDLPLKELNEKNLGIQIVYTPLKKSRKIVGFRFDCIDSIKIAKVDQSKYAYIEDKSVKEDSNNVDVEDVKMEGIMTIAKNPIRYAELLDEERKNPNIFGFSPEVSALIRLGEELKAAEEDAKTKAESSN